MVVGDEYETKNDEKPKKLQEREIYLMSCRLNHKYNTTKKKRKSNLKEKDILMIKILDKIIKRINERTMNGPDRQDTMQGWDSGFSFFLWFYPVFTVFFTIFLSRKN